MSGHTSPAQGFRWPLALSSKHLVRFVPSILQFYPRYHICAESLAQKSPRIACAGIPIHNPCKYRGKPADRHNLEPYWDAEAEAKKAGIGSRINQSTSFAMEWFVLKVYTPFLSRVLHFRYVVLCTAIALLLTVVGIVKGGLVKSDRDCFKQFLQFCYS